MLEPVCVLAGIGMRGANQGVPLSELLLAFTATKNCLWEYLEQDSLLEDPVDWRSELAALSRTFVRVLLACFTRRHREVAKL
jgi:hypothetical protein